MELDTPRLQIRNVTLADVPAIVGLWTDPEVTRYLGGPRDAATITASLEADVAKTDPSLLAVLPAVEKATNSIVGHCGLIAKEVEGLSETELIYVIAKSAWGKGYATEAGGAVMAHAFGAMGLDRLIALIDPRNAASGRVAEKLGMRLERETVRPTGKTLRVYARER